MRPKYTFRGVVVRSNPARIKPQGGIARAGSSAAPAKVRVSREIAGRAGKPASVVSGLPLPEAELEALAARLKRLCGAGGTVKDGRIEIQGDHRDRLVEELVKLGYDAKRSGG